MIEVEEITDNRAYPQLLSAFDGWGITKQDAVDLLDTGANWPPCLPSIPLWLFDRTADETYRDYMTADRARRERRQRTARALLRIIMEQARTEDLNAAAETLARLLARGKTRSQSRSEARVRPDGRLRRPDARQAGRRRDSPPRPWPVTLSYRSR